MMASTPTRTASALDPLEYGASIATPHSSFGILVAPAPDVCDGVDGTVRGNSHRLALSSSHPLTDLRLHIADVETCAHSRIFSTPRQTTHCCTRTRASMFVYTVRYLYMKPVGAQLQEAIP